jgi:FtsZ-binding cell division protein ZapB
MWKKIVILSIYFPPVLLSFQFSQLTFAANVETRGDLRVTGAVDNTGGTGIIFPDGSNQTKACSGCANGILSISLGGTGTSIAPAEEGQFLRSISPGFWGVSNIQAGDIPPLSGQYMDLTSVQTITGAKTFATTINGNISGNAATATSASTATTAGNVTGTVAIANGGTGSGTAAGALSNLGGVNKGGDTMTGGLTVPNLTASGNVTATGSVSSANFRIGSDLFAYGSITNANVFLGFAGNTTMTGTINTAVGSGALIHNTTGPYNTAVGHNALFSHQTGQNNTAIGDSALFSNISGDNNIALGSQALQNNTGKNNTAVGFRALLTNGAGNDNTALGLYADVGSSDLTYATAIGTRAYVTQSNSLVLGSINGVNGATSTTRVGIGTTAPSYTFHIVDSITGTGVYSESTSFNGNGVIGIANNGTSAYGVWGQSNSGYAGYFSGKVTVTGCLTAGGTPLGGACPSDARLKTNIKPLEHSLDKLAALQPVSFDWRAENTAGYRSDSDETAIGLVAQQVEELFPDMVSTDKNGYKRVDYGRLPLMLLAGMKELKARNDSLNVQVREQQGRIEALNRQVQQLQEAQARLAAAVERLACAQGETQVVSSAALDLTSEPH